MKKLLSFLPKKTLPFLLTLSLGFTSCAATRTPAQVVAAIEPSLVKVQYVLPETNETHVCAGFVINSEDRLILTARHCVEEGREHFVNGSQAEIVKVSDSLAVVRGETPLGPSVKIRKRPLKRGEEVVGLGFGLSIYMSSVGHVAVPLYKDGSVWLDRLLNQGMSGGPVVDMNGEVIGISQLADSLNDLAVLCGQDEMSEFIRELK
jgi:S1-C subfamily serine protease